MVAIIAGLRRSINVILPIYCYPGAPAQMDAGLVPVVGTHRPRAAPRRTMVATPAPAAPAMAAAGRCE